MFDHILVATDLTDQSDSAVRTAVQLGKSFGPAITIAHVVAMPPVLRRWNADVFREDLDAYHDLLERQIKAAKTAAERQVSSAGLTSKRGVKVVVRAGDPALTLGEIAHGLDVDLVVVARGRGGVLGRVAEGLVRIVGRSVLVTPTTPRRALNKKKSPARTRRTRTA